MTLLRAAIVLGLLSAVGSFAIDMYLPAMPSIAMGLGADETAVQLTLISYFVSFGIAQLVYGPWADQAGRKIPLFTGISVFVVGSIGCALAPNIGWLIGFRALQGIGGAVLMVVPRAVIRDMHTGTQATRLMAMVMLVISVSPMLAPLVGSGLIAIGDWRFIFWALAFGGLLSLGLTGFALPETLAPAARVPVRVKTLLAGATVLIKDPVFMGLTLIGGFGFASFMVFIASASFVYTNQFGLTPTGFSIAFAINAVGFFGASQLAGPLGDRFGVLALMRLAVIGFAVVTATLFALAMMGGVTLVTIVTGLFFANGFLGLVLPTTMVMALEEHGDIAGLASSLGGTLQMVSAGAVVAIAGLFFDGTATPMVAAIAMCALCAMALALKTVATMAGRHTTAA